ncbi:MAG: hypothetical protein N2170_03215 [Bacteroidia bacterium]|nr:hypothetical protein [Bacteroidia bacterium]
MRIGIALLLLSFLWAQDAPVSLAIALRAHSGLGIGFFGKLQDDLKASTALGKDFQLIPWATTAGANIDFLFAKKILLSGTLQLQHYDASETERGLARPYALHYGGQLGFALINKNLWLFYPYLGYQVGRYEVRYTNYFTEPIFFGSNQELRPLEKRTFSSNLGLVEVGVGLRRWKRGEGISLLWGADLGGVLSPSKGSWSASQGPAPAGVNPPQLRGGYLRFSLGFGYVKPVSETSSPLPPAPGERPEKERRKKTEVAPSTSPSPSPAPEKPKKKKAAEDDE